MALAQPENIKNQAAFIWSVADLLRGNYKQPETAAGPEEGHPFTHPGGSGFGDAA